MLYSQRVFEIITENPGINGGEIARILSTELGREYTVKNLNSILGGLKRRHHDFIENRGTGGMGARWYVAPPLPPTEPNPYLKEAERILHDMKRIMPSHRAEWLAEQLQVLIDP